MRWRLSAVLGLVLPSMACLTPAKPPVVVPPAPPTHNDACVVTNAISHQPILGARCALEGQTAATNGDGYHLFLAIPAGARTLVVTADGYVAGAQAFTNDHDQNVAIALTPVFPLDFTRAQIGAMHASWQGCVYHLASGDVPAWGIAGYGDADRAQAYADEKACGNTHVLIGLSGAYHEPGTLLPPTLGQDFAYDLPTWKARIEEALQRGFIPVLPLACDGHSPQHGDGGPGVYSDPVGWTYGKEWCEKNLARVLGYLDDGDDHLRLRHKVGLMAGFELINNGGYSPQDWIEMHQAIRAVWPDAFVFGEIGGYTWGGDADPAFPNGPVGWWTGPGGQTIDGIIEEFNSPFAADVRTDYEQVAAAHVVPHGADQSPCLAAGIHAANCIQYELTAGGTPRGPWFVIAGEIASYDWVRRGPAMLDALNEKRAELRALGFPWVN